jgi:uncharacterized surface protein with fasciclin (FAS1) repeats
MKYSSGIYAALLLLAVVISVSAADYSTGNVNGVPEKNIVETAIDAGNFNTLVEAVLAAGLAETLSSPGPFTVFAPTDDAFAKIPSETLQNILENKEQLTSILTYHVVNEKLMSTDLENGMSIETVQGGDLLIETTEGVMVNNAKVVQADIECTNGVIHAIDTVLIPPAEALTEAAAEVVHTNEEIPSEKEEPSTPGFQAIMLFSCFAALAYIFIWKHK